MVAHSPTLPAEDTNAVCLVDHYRAVVLLLQRHYLRQLGQVALHGEHAIDDNELDGILRQLLQQPLQVFHVVVLVVQLASKSQTAPVNDGGMVTIVADDIVVLAQQCWDDALIDAESR